MQLEYLIIRFLARDDAPGALDRMPEERAALGLFCELVLGADIASESGTSAAGTTVSTRSWRSGAWHRAGSICRPR
jgi:hypothetical protein